jgi:O-succinylbenzoic acid--CoA ligase
MANALSTLLCQRWGDDWLMGVNSQKFWQDLEALSQTWPAPAAAGSLMVIATADPLQFLTQFFGACRLGYTVVLANPHWGEREWAQVQPMLMADIPAPPGDTGNQALAHHPEAPEQGLAPLPVGQCWPPYHPDADYNGEPLVLIPTGGSSGQVKFVIHSWSTLMASVAGFQAHFRLDRVNAYCVLPLCHVSGLMQVLRAFMTGGQLVLQPYRQLKRGQMLACPGQGFLSLVPTQLQWLLGQGNAYIPWLRGFRAVLVGGAPVWPSLLQQAREAQLPLALTYGMTETASQVATLLPEQFLAGTTSSGGPLPHAHLHILDDQGQPLGQGQTGRVGITAESLGWGYVWPGCPWQVVTLNQTLQSDPGGATDRQGRGIRGISNAGRRPCPQGAARTLDGTGPPPREHLLVTDDVGFLDQSGHLHIVGRSSSMLISGGEKVFPEEVEAALLATGAVKEACVVGRPDCQWGQRICALVVGLQVSGLAALAPGLATRLAAYKCPKDWIVVEALPRTPQGKVNRRRALELAQIVLGEDQP